MIIYVIVVICLCLRVDLIFFLVEEMDFYCYRLCKLDLDFYYYLQFKLDMIVKIFGKYERYLNDMRVGEVYIL